jgi:hypothetical protein
LTRPERDEELEDLDADERDRPDEPERPEEDELLARAERTEADPEARGAATDLPGDGRVDRGALTERPDDPPEDLGATDERDEAPGLIEDEPEFGRREADTPVEREEDAD